LRPREEKAASARASRELHSVLSNIFHAIHPSQWKTATQGAGLLWSLRRSSFGWKQSFTGRFREYLLTMFAFHRSNRRSVQFCILFERKIEVSLAEQHDRIESTDMSQSHVQKHIDLIAKRTRLSGSPHRSRASR
jgi:hypothetical protein